MAEQSTPDLFHDMAERATLLRDQGQGAEAAALYQQAGKHYQEVGDAKTAARCWHGAGISWKIEGKTDEALQALNKATGLYQQANESFGPGRVKRDIAIYTVQQA